MPLGLTETLSSVHPQSHNVEDTYESLFTFAQEQIVTRELQTAPTYAAICKEQLGIRVNKNILAACTATDNIKSVGEEHANEHVSDDLLWDAQNLLLNRELLGSKGLLAVAAVLPFLGYLIIVDVSHSQLDSPLLACLCKGLGRLPHLRTVDVSHNSGVGSLGATALVNMLIVNAGICEVRVEGIEMISSVHRRISQLTEKARRHQERSEESESQQPPQEQVSESEAKE